MVMSPVRQGRRFDMQMAPTALNIYPVVHSGRISLTLQTAN